MKNFLSILITLSFSIYSCSEKDPLSLDVTVTGLEDISMKSGDVKTTPLSVSFDNDMQGSVVLSVENVPNGVQCELSKTTGTESFTTELEVSVSNEAEAGEHDITLKSVTNEGTIENYTFTLEVVKTLSITFETFNAITWTAEDPSFDLVEGAVITLYDSDMNAITTATTDEEGTAEFFNLEEDKTYFFTAETETLSNLTDQSEIEGKTVGYIVNGVFETQEEIDNSAQPFASVGDIELADVNGDQMISSDDKTTGKWLQYEVETRPIAVTVYLADKNP